MTFKNIYFILIINSESEFNDLMRTLNEFKIDEFNAKVEEEIWKVKKKLIIS